MSSPTPDTVGVIHGLSNEAYHKGPGLSQSGAKRLLKSPFHFWSLAQPHDEPPTPPTSQQFNGTLVHCATLEPKQWDLRYALAPALSKNSNAYRDWAADAQERGLEPVTPLQRDRAFAQALALRTLPDVARLLERGEAESSAYWRDPLTAVHCKCRPDFASTGWGADAQAVILLDVKTTSDASPEQFAKSVLNFGYHMQADWYCAGYALATGHEVLGMVFAVVESDYPHATAAYNLDARSLALGRKLNDRARVLYAQCEKRGVWPSYPTEVVELTLPAWAWRQADEQ